MVHVGRNPTLSLLFTNDELPVQAGVECIQRNAEQYLIRPEGSQKGVKEACTRQSLTVADVGDDTDRHLVGETGAPSVMGHILSVGFPQKLSSVGTLLLHKICWSLLGTVWY